MIVPRPHRCVDLPASRDTSSEVGPPSAVGALRSVRTAPGSGRGTGAGRRERRERMSKGLRRFLILAVVAVLLFFVISQPEGAADVVRSIVAIIGQALSSISQFFRSLF